MKYVSIDIETSGLDPERHSILEVAAVATEIGSPTRHMFRALVIPNGMQVQTDPYCAILHMRLWEELLAFQLNSNSPNMIFLDKSQYGVVMNGQSLPGLVGNNLAIFLNTVWPDHQRKDKITVAGKNPGTFDIPFLRKQTDFTECVQVHHRVLDVTSHFCRPDVDKCLPDLKTCVERAGIAKRTQHDAMADCLTVCDLIDKAFLG